MSSNTNFNFSINKLAERLKQLLNNQYLSDVTFKVGNRRNPIYAHKNVITMASEVFYAHFNGKFAETNNHESPTVVVIEDINEKTFLALMRYIYCDEVQVTSENVLDMYYASQKYLIQDLIDRCEEFLQTSINETNALTILDTNHYKFPVIDQQCLAIVQENPLKYFQLEYFLKINPRTMQLIAELETMNCYKSHVEDAINSWKKANSVDECDIVPKQKNKLLCQKVPCFSTADFSHKINTNLSLTAKKPLKLYGLGLYVGTKEHVFGGTLTFEIDIEGENSISMIKKTSLDSELYTCTVMFERVTIINRGVIRISVQASTPEAEIFCLKKFIPVKKIEGFNVLTERKQHLYYNSSVGCECRFDENHRNCIAYLLYNVEDDVITSNI